MATAGATDTASLEEQQHSADDSKKDLGSQKRSLEGQEEEETAQKRPRPNDINVDEKVGASSDAMKAESVESSVDVLACDNKGVEKPRKRWRAHQMAQDYIDMVGNLMYPGIRLGPFGYNATAGQYPTERLSSLGYLASPLRRPTVLEKWSPYQVSMFEASLCVYGKVFHKIQKAVPSKTTKDLVEFYYVWKKTSHYKAWKEQFMAHIEETAGSSDEEEEKQKDVLVRRRNK